MWLIVNQSVAPGIIPINTRQQRASFLFKPSVLERKVYNNEDITLFSILTFAKPSCDDVLQSSPLPGLDCNTLSHLGLPNVNARKRMLNIKRTEEQCVLFHGENGYYPVPPGGLSIHTII